MKYSFVYNTENHNKIMSSVVGMGIDSPITSLITEGPDFLFSGWVIPRGNNAKCKWLLNYKDFQVELALNFERPDVVEYFSKDCVSVLLTCGFKKKVLLDGLNNITLSLDGAEQVCFTVNRHSDIFIPPNDKLLNDGSLLWLKMHSGASLTTEDQKVTFESISDSFKVISVEDYVASVGKVSSDAESVGHILEKLFDPQWPFDAIKDYSTKGYLSISGIDSEERLVCKFSVNVHYVNFIYFESKAESLYLVQYCRNVAIIFPRIMLVVSEYVDTDWVNEPLSKIPYLSQYLREYAIKYSLFVSDKITFAKFLGFNVSQPRPYHYFYDYLYGLWLLHSQGVTNCSIFSIKRCDFWTDFEGICERFYICDDSELNTKVLSSRGFLIMPCIEYSRAKNAFLFDSFSDFLVKKSEKYCSHLFPSVEVQKNQIVLWVGVSSEKRSWIEQIDGFSNIFTQLLTVFESLLVLVDGRTFPANPSPHDFSNKNIEDKLFSELVRKNSNVSFINMIGMQAIEKICMAKKVDFFICSYATDSIYPSAICKKPGVVYVAPSVGDQKALHIHHNINEVPSDKIKEVLPSDGVKKSWHETSISMDWRDVFECVLQLINDYGIKK